MIRRFTRLLPVLLALVMAGMAPVNAATWQTLKHATFSRANTSTGVANNQTSVGENWIDSLGSVWRINNNLLTGIGSATPGNTLLRPKSEAQTEQRVAFTKTMETNNQTCGIVLREQADTSRYYCFLGGTTFRINRVSSSNVVTSLVSVVLTTGPRQFDVMTLDFQVTGGAGNPALSATYTDGTTGETNTITFTDSNAAKIVTAGQCGLDLGFATTFTFSSVDIYYDNPSSATVTPFAVQSGVSNTLLTLVGTGTTFTNGQTATMTASGSNGASIGTVTFIDTTHLTINLVNSGSVNDSLLIKDNASGTLTIVSVTAPVITITPLQIITSTSGNVMTVLGNVQKWNSSAPIFALSGVSGASITNTTVVNDTTATITVTTGTSAGTVTLTDSNSSFTATTTFSIAYAIKVDDPNLTLSPYNCQLSGSKFADINYAGAYGRVRFTTTATAPIAFLYDPTPNVNGGLAASNYPTIGYSINPTATGGKWTYQQLSSNTGTVTLSASAVAGTYDVWFYIKAIRGGTDGGRWNPSARKVRFLGIQVDPSAVTVFVAPRSKYAIMYGDSITQGAGTLGISNTTNDDSFQSWARSCADGLSAEYGNIGMSGQQWGNTLTTIPAFFSAANTPNDTFTYYEAGQSRLVSGHLSPVPDYVFVAMGTNDGTSNIASNVQSTLVQLRAITSSTTPIFLVLPFGGFESSGTTGIPAGFNNYKAAVPTDHYVFVIDPTSLYPIAGLNNSTGTSENFYTFDGLHPKGYISLVYGAFIARQAQLDLGLPTGGSVGSHQIKRGR